MGVPYIIKSFRGGISDENNKGVAGSFGYGSSLDIHKRVDSLMGGSAMTTIDSTVTTDLIKFFVPCLDGSTYAFGSTGSIYAISGNIGDPAVNFVYNDENGNIKGAAEFRLSTGVNYLFWATDTSVARTAIDGQLAVPWAAGVATQDWKTTLNNVPDGWHTMDLISGQLMIANGNALATVDYDGNFNASALNLRPGNLIRCLEERDDYAIIGSYRWDNGEEGHIWSWITTATNWVQKKKIQVRGINAMIMAEQLFFQGGTNGEIFNTDFTNATPLHAIPGGGQVNPGGTSIVNELAVFGLFGDTTNANSGIWSYGRRNKNRPYALNYEYQLAAPSGNRKLSTIGAISTVGGNLLASWGQTDSDGASFYGIDQISTTTRANAIYHGLEFDAHQPHEKKEFNTVKVLMSPLPAGTSISVKYRKTYATTGGDSGAGPKGNPNLGWQYAILGDGTTTFSQTNQTEALFSIGIFTNVYEVGAELNASGADSPEIHALVTYLTGESYSYA